MLTYFISVLFFLLATVVVGALFLLFKKIEAMSKEQGDTQPMLMLQNQINEINKTLDSKLQESTRQLQTHFGQNYSIIKSVAEELTSLRETNKQVMGFSEQLSNLERVLTNQKQRGNLGEAGLRLVLENILPPTAYQLQYRFDDGDIVDAAVVTKDGIIPVDAKFSLDNYNRILQETDDVRKLALEKEFKTDLKKRIDETSKYIKPDKGTLDFAFMFIPAEAIYYDLLVNEVGAIKVNTQSLIDYAFKEKRVIIVSPTTFAAYLQTVLHGLHALKIEKSAQEIRKRVEQLGRHLQSYHTYLDKLGNNLGTTVGMYNAAAKEFKKIDKDVVRIAGGDGGPEPLLIEKPHHDE